MENWICYALLLSISYRTEKLVAGSGVEIGAFQVIQATASRLSIGGFSEISTESELSEFELL